MLTVAIIQTHIQIIPVFLMGIRSLIVEAGRTFASVYVDIIVYIYRSMRCTIICDELMVFVDVRNTLGVIHGKPRIGITSIQ